MILKQLLCEALGAFAIVFGGCGAIIINQLSDGSITHVGIAASFGLIVMVMVYALGHISGAHFNPAVTIAFSIAKVFPKNKIILYVLAQCTGAVIASAVHYLLFSSPSLIDIDFGVTVPYDCFALTAFSMEVIVTFFLMVVIMAVATDSRAMGPHAGFAIGSVIFCAALIAGPVCGASMNPARSLGPALITNNWECFLAYIFGPITGAAAGAWFYQYVRQVNSPNESP